MRHTGTCQWVFEVRKDGRRRQVRQVWNFEGLRREKGSRLSVVEREGAEVRELEQRTNDRAVA